MEAIALQPIWLALIIAIPAMISPVVASWLNNRNQSAQKRLDAETRSAEKKEEYARQDLVAAQALAAADKAAAKVENAAKLLLESNDKVAEVAKDAASRTHSKLNAIHGLVNSAYMAAKQSELAAFVSMLTLMQEVNDVKIAAGREPNPETLIDIANTKKRIAELRIFIADLEKQAAIAEAKGIFK